MNIGSKAGIHAGTLVSLVQIANGSTLAAIGLLQYWLVIINRLFVVRQWRLDEVYITGGVVRLFRMTGGICLHHFLKTFILISTGRPHRACPEHMRTIAPLTANVQ